MVPLTLDYRLRAAAKPIEVSEADAIDTGRKPPGPETPDQA